MEALSDASTEAECYCVQDGEKSGNHGRTPRKRKQPQRTPVRSRDSNSSIVLHFELVNETPTPMLKIRASGNVLPTLKARRRLFGRGYSWNACSESHAREQFNGQVDSNTESSDEADTQDTVSLDQIGVDIRPKECKSAHKVKVCASCKTKKTPLWRDAEDGTPYCNACGIRFKKYRICCPSCSYIPRKDEKLGNTCCQCGSKLLQYKLR